MTETRGVSARATYDRTCWCRAIRIEENMRAGSTPTTRTCRPRPSDGHGPTDWLYGYNVPINDSSDSAQVGKVIQRAVAGQRRGPRLPPRRGP